MQWHALQVNLEQAESDVLLLLDCCAAGSAMSDCTGPGTKEMLVACGFETWTPGVGRHSFTTSLIEELKTLRHRGPFTVSVLHAAVTRNIKAKSDQRLINGMKPGTKSPLHYTLTTERWKRSIELVPLHEDIDKSSDAPKSHVCPPAATVDDDRMTGLECDTSALREFVPDPLFKYPKVLLSVALEDKQWLHQDSWISWLQSMPALVRYATLQGEFDSFSSVLLISVPIPIWNLMEDNPAIHFVAFIKSNNRLLLTADERTLLSPLEEVGTSPLPTTPLVHDPASPGSADSVIDVGDECTSSYARNPSTAQTSFSFNIMKESQRTWWFCCNLECTFRGPYSPHLHTTCTVGCQHKRCNNCKTEIVVTLNERG